MHILEIYHFLNQFYYFSGILYNVVLNVKQSNTEAELQKLKESLGSQNEILEKLSGDLSDISEKISIVESDLENVKAANKDIEDLHEIKDKLLSYATTLNKVEKTEEAFLASSSYHFRPSYLGVIVIFNLIVQIILM